MDAKENGGAPCIEYTPIADMINPAGVVFGGFLAAMLDDIMGMVTWQHSQRAFKTAQLSVSFLSAAKPDQIIVATAEVIRHSNGQAFIEATLMEKSELRIIAKASAVQLFSRPPKD